MINSHDNNHLIFDPDDFAVTGLVYLVKPAKRYRWNSGWSHKTRGLLDLNYNWLTFTRGSRNEVVEMIRLWTKLVVGIYFTARMCPLILVYQLYFLSILPYLIRSFRTIQY